MHIMSHGARRSARIETMGNIDDVYEDDMALVGAPVLKLQK